MLGEMNPLPPPGTARRGPPATGLSLIELMVGLAIAAVLLAIALPSMNEFVARQRVAGVATGLVADIRFARSTQMQTSRPVRLMFNANTNVTCYIAHSLSPGGNCNCAVANPPYCLALPGALVPTEYKSAVLLRSQGITVKPAVGTPGELIFDATSSLTRNAAQLTIDIQGTTGGHVRVLTTATGQPRICSVSGHASAFPACAS